MPRGPAPTLTLKDMKTALKRHGGRIAPIAAEFDLSRQTIYNALRRYGLSARTMTAADRRQRARKASQARWKAA